MQPAQAAPLAAIGEAPAYIQALYDPEVSHMKDFGHLEPADFGLSFLKIVQGTEKHGRPGWGPTGVEQAMIQGTYIIDKTHQVLPVGTEFIPLLRSVSYMKGRTENLDDGIEFITSNKDDPRIVACNGLEWREDPRTKARIPPLVTAMVKFYVVTRFNMEEPAVLSFQRTGTPVGRQLTKDISNATKHKGKPMALPMYICKFQLVAPKLTSEGKLSWFNHSYQPAGFVKESFLPHLKKLYEFAQVLDDASKTVNSPSDRRVMAQGLEGSGTPVESQPLPGQAPEAPPPAAAPQAPPAQPQPQAQPQAQPQPQPQPTVINVPPPAGTPNVAVPSPNAQPAPAAQPNAAPGTQPPSELF
jgi:hypothetical protein